MKRLLPGAGKAKDAVHVTRGVNHSNDLQRPGFEAIDDQIHFFPVPARLAIRPGSARG